MCLNCHQFMCDDDILQQLEEAITNNQFDRWNTTSIGHMLLVASGFNGAKCRNLALTILNQFIKWYNDKPDGYLPSHGIEPMYSKKYIAAMIESLASRVEIGDRDQSLDWLAQCQQLNINLQC